MRKLGAVPGIPEAKARASDHVQSLVLDRNGRVLSFQFDRLYEKYFVLDDGAILLEANLFGTFPAHVRQIVDRTLVTYAARFKAAAAKEEEIPP